MNRRLALMIYFVILLISMVGVAFEVQRTKAVSSFDLFGSASGGWGFTSGTITSPGPTITVNQGDLVDLTLTSVDGLTHNFFVDYNGDSNPSAGEPKSPDFRTSTINYQFTADTFGTFTYYCQYHKFVMYGTFVVAQTSDTNPPSISILSPENKTYSVNAVPLTFTLNEPTSWIGYSLNGQTNATIGGNTTIGGLPEGTHTVAVYANDTFGNMGSSDTVYFSIQASPADITPPTVSILSPENRTYATTDIPLTLTIDESGSSMGYSLDGQANVTITGNTTLTGLSEGAHRIVVYATDTAGNTGTSEIIYFTIETGEPEPFPTMVVAAVVILAILGAALLVYFVKVRKKPEKAK